VVGLLYSFAYNLLVERMTLNHRVPGSSPGAPTNIFKYLYRISPLETKVESSWGHTGDTKLACALGPPIGTPHALMQITDLVESSSRWRVATLARAPGPTSAVPAECL
jgi:hypothetical protein